MELYHLPTFLLKLDEEFSSPSKKPEQDYDTFITTTTITKVESTLDKLKEARAINDEARRDNILRMSPSNSINNV